MKSPAELAERWVTQWQLADNREQRLLFADTWPVSLSIGRPSPTQFTHQTDQVREHVRRWRAVTIGQVVWESLNFRGGSEPVNVPARWVLRGPSEWVAACGNHAITLEYERLSRLAAAVDPMFRRSMIRLRHLIQDKPEAEIIKAAEVALMLSPGDAAGRPLRAMSVAGIDSKFFERQRNLIIHLLDIRFDGQVSDIGLETFLDALDEREHWLLVTPLTPELLPFAQQKVRAGELAITPLAASHIVIVENERCFYQLPYLPDTIAVLGAGLNLEWMGSEWLGSKRVAYWGDIDTWGLMMLARARSLQPHLSSMLMTREIFDACSPTAVAEIRRADEQPPEGLTTCEQSLFRYLCGLEKGRIEQEFLPRELVVEALTMWRGGGTEL